MNVEKVQATFLDDVFIMPQNDIVYRLNQRGDRFYFKIDENGNAIIKPSVTSIIKKYSSMSPFLLQWWCKNGYEKSKVLLKESSMYGTFMHILWSKLLLKYNLDMSEEGIKQELFKYFDSENEKFEYDFNEWHGKAKQNLIGFVKWAQDYKVKPMAIEMSLIGEQYSGTIDLVCQVTYKGDSYNAIIDWKSGRNDFYDDYAIQLEAYRQLWNEKFPDKEIKRIFNYGCKDFKLPIGKTVTPYRFKEQTFNPMIYRWNPYLLMYTTEVPDPKLEKRTEIIEATINIESDINDLIKEIDPLEFLEDGDGKTESN